jgi:hypothetical protein
VLPDPGGDPATALPSTGLPARMRFPDGRVKILRRSAPPRGHRYHAQTPQPAPQNSGLRPPARPPCAGQGRWQTPPPVPAGPGGAARVGLVRLPVSLRALPRAAPVPKSGGSVGRSREHRQRSQPGRYRAVPSEHARSLHSRATGAPPPAPRGWAVVRIGRAFWDIRAADVGHPYPSIGRARGQQRSVRRRASRRVNQRAFGFDCRW